MDWNRKGNRSSSPPSHNHWPGPDGAVGAGGVEVFTFSAKRAPKRSLNDDPLADSNLPSKMSERSIAASSS